MHRRHLLAGLLGIAAQPLFAQPRGRRITIPFDPAIAAIERKHGGRLGVFALDTATRKTMNWRADERFTMCSTFKVLLAAQVLAKVDVTVNTLTPIEITGITTDTGVSASDYVTTDTLLSYGGTVPVLATGEKVRVQILNASTQAVIM